MIVVGFISCLRFIYVIPEWPHRTEEFIAKNSRFFFAHFRMEWLVACFIFSAMVFNKSTTGGQYAGNQKFVKAV